MFEKVDLIAESLRLSLIQRAIVRAVAGLPPGPKDAVYFRDAVSFLRDAEPMRAKRPTSNSPTTPRTWALHEGTLRTSELAQQIASEDPIDLHKLIRTAEVMGNSLRKGGIGPPADDLQALRAYVGAQMQKLTARSRTATMARHTSDVDSGWALADMLL